MHTKYNKRSKVAQNDGDDLSRPPHHRSFREQLIMMGSSFRPPHHVKWHGEWWRSWRNRAMMGRTWVVPITLSRQTFSHGRREKVWKKKEEGKIYWNFLLFSKMQSTNFIDFKQTSLDRYRATNIHEFNSFEKNEESIVKWAPNFVKTETLANQNNNLYILKANFRI